MVLVLAFQLDLGFGLHFGMGNSKGDWSRLVASVRFRVRIRHSCTWRIGLLLELWFWLMLD